MNTTQNVIEVCLGSSCFSRGNTRNLEIIKEYIKENELSVEVVLKGHLCNNKCNRGPVVRIDENIYEGVTNSSIIKILESHFLK